MLDFVMVSCTLRRDIASASAQWRNNFLFRISERPCRNIDGGDDTCDLAFRLQPLINEFNRQLQPGQWVSLRGVQTNGLQIIPSLHIQANNQREFPSLTMSWFLTTMRINFLVRLGYYAQIIALGQEANARTDGQGHPGLSEIDLITYTAYVMSAPSMMGVMAQVIMRHNALHPPNVYEILFDHTQDVTYSTTDRIHETFEYDLLDISWWTVDSFIELAGEFFVSMTTPDPDFSYSSFYEMLSTRTSDYPHNDQTLAAAMARGLDTTMYRFLNLADWVMEVDVMVADNNNPTAQPSRLTVNVTDAIPALTQNLQRDTVSLLFSWFDFMRNAGLIQVPPNQDQDGNGDETQGQCHNICQGDACQEEPLDLSMSRHRKRRSSPQVDGNSSPELHQLQPLCPVKDLKSAR